MLQVYPVPAGISCLLFTRHLPAISGRCPTILGLRKKWLSQKGLNMVKESL
jgi:hypothetical protein